MIRDLDYLSARSTTTEAVLIYHYRSDLMRRAMRDSIARQFAGSQRPLVACTPAEFTTLTTEGRLFDPVEFVPFLDFGTAPAPDRNSLDESCIQRPINVLNHLLSRAATSAVLFLPSREIKELEKMGCWPLREAEGVLVVESPLRIMRSDISRLVAAMASLRRRSPSDEAIAYTTAAVGEMWWDTRELESLAEATDRHLVRGLPDSAVVSRSTKTFGHSNIITSMLSRVISGEGGRDEILRHFEPYRDGRGVVAALLSVTARLVLMASRPAFGIKRGSEGAKRLAIWILLLLSRTERLASAAGTSLLWASADLRLFELQMLLDDYLQASAGGPAEMAPWTMDAVAGGASAARGISLELSQRLAGRLEILMPDVRRLDEGDPLWDALRHAQSTLSVELQAGPSQAGGETAILTSLDQLIGREAAPFVFLQRFAARRFERPLLLFGPDDVGKRVVANLLAKLFVCSVATPDHPDACGHCFGCRTADITIANLDMLAYAGTAADDFVTKAVASRGTVAGPAVSIVHGIEIVSRVTQDEILKRVEGGESSGLTIFTTRCLLTLSDALRSRCLTIPLLPLQRSQVDTFIERQFPNIQETHPHADLEMAIKNTAGLPGRIIRAFS